MSVKPTNLGPCAAYAEDVQEDTQTTIPGTKQSSQVKTKRSKRDEYSDSGYSSRTAATNGSQSTSGSSKLLNFVGRMAASKKKSHKEAAEAMSSKASSKKATSQRKQELKVDTNIESREDAARIQLSGEPVQRTPSNRSYETSPRLSRSVKPSPPHTQHVPLRQNAPPSRVSMSRPMSYHGASYHNVSYSQPISYATYSQPIQTPHQPFQQPQMTYVPSMSPTMMLPRQPTYAFEPTLPGQYLPPVAGWDARYQTSFVQPHSSQPPISRRYSMAGPPVQPIVEYPPIPARTVPRPIAYTNKIASYTQAIADEGMEIEDNETYYAREEEARRRMPPPPLQRPLMRHASTTSAVRRVNRDSIEYKQRTTNSSPTEQPRRSTDEGRVPLLSRSSSSRNVPVRVVDGQRSPDHPRRSRPASFLAAGGIDQETAAERYQARQRGAIEPQALEVRDVEKVKKKSSKGHKSKASDSGSRSSEGKKASIVKRRPVSRQKPSGEGLSLEVGEGCTATLRRDSKGYIVQVSPNEDTKARSARPTEREELKDSRRYSASGNGRRESITEKIARSIAPRRPSSSHPTSRRSKIEATTEAEGLDKRLTEKYKAIDDTAVEDDEYSEAEPRRRKTSDSKLEKLTPSRLHRLKSGGESRQSSQSGRSTKSNRSNKSISSSKNSAFVEGKPF